MRPMSISTGFGLFAMCLVGLTGCSKAKTNTPPSQAAVAAHHHHHGAQRGLHGGFIIGLDIENYHAELTRDEKTNLSPRVTVRCSVGGQIVEAFATVSEFEHPDEVRGALLARTCR